MPKSLRRPSSASARASLTLAGLTVLGVGLAVSACHVEAKVNASTSESEGRVEPSTTQTTAQASPPAPVTAPAPPAADACPLTCYEARGSERAALTDDETAQVRSALEPIILRMRQCVTPDEWRRHGSPMMNLRLAPDGTLADFGMDPDEAHQSLCIDNAGRGASATLTLPTRKVVRCREYCVRESTRRGRRPR